MWRSTACLAVCAAIRLKSSDGSTSTTVEPSARTTLLRTSSAPEAVSSFTLTSPGGLNARLYAAARALSTVCSISSKGMPTSAQSAVSASARVWVDGSDGDREPARDNVFPSDMSYDRCPPSHAWRLHRNPRVIDRDQLPLDHAVSLATPVPDVDALSVETRVLVPASERAFGARRRDLQLVTTIDEVGVVEQWTGNPAHSLAVFDRDRVIVVDRDAESPSRLA